MRSASPSIASREDAAAASVPLGFLRFPRNPLRPPGLIEPQLFCTCSPDLRLVCPETASHLRRANFPPPAQRLDGFVEARVFITPDRRSQPPIFERFRSTQYPGLRRIRIPSSIAAANVIKQGSRHAGSTPMPGSFIKGEPAIASGSIPGVNTGFGLREPKMSIGSAEDEIPLWGGSCAAWSAVLVWVPRRVHHRQPQSLSTARMGFVVTSSASRPYQIVD